MGGDVGCGLVLGRDSVGREARGELSRQVFQGIYFRCPMLSLDTRGKNRASVNL